MKELQINENLDTKIESQGKKLVEAAGVMVVDSAASREKAGEMLRRLKDQEKEVKGYFEDMRKKAHDAKQAILNKINAGIKPIQTAIPILSKKMIDYDQEEARIAAAAAEKLRQEQENLARVAAENERKRLEKAKMEAIENNDEEALDRAEYEGKILTPQTVKIPVPLSVPTIVTKPKGYVSKWKATVTNLPALIRAAHENPEMYGAYVVADEKALNKFAPVAKDKMRIPGVVFQDEGIIRSR